MLVLAILQSTLRLMHSTLLRHARPTSLYTTCCRVMEHENEPLLKAGKVDMQQDSSSLLGTGESNNDGMLAS